MTEKETHTIAVTGAERLPSSEQPELDAQLAQLRTHLERGDIRDARKLVQRLEEEWPQSERVRKLARTLAPPETRLLPGVRGPSRDREREWLHHHAHEYPNQWLAILGDWLVAADPDARVVIAAVRQTPGAQRALIHFQPGPSD